MIIIIILTIHATLRLLCLFVIFYPVYNESSPIQIFSHVIKPNCSACSLLILPCLSSPAFEEQEEEKEGEKEEEESNGVFI